MSSSTKRTEVEMFAPTPICRRRSPLINVVLMGSLIAALILLTNVLCRNLHGGEIDFRRAATVRVKAPNSRGSGVCVSHDGLIITAGHVIYSPGAKKLFGSDPIQMPTAVEVTFPGRKTEAARVLAVSRTGEPADLAVLQCAGTEYPYLDLAERSPAVGSPIVTLGYPAGNFCLLEGNVTFVGLSTDSTSDAITSTGRTQPGHSGGPLLNATDQVIGIASQATVDHVSICGKLVLEEQLAYYTRVEQIHALLADRKINLRQTAGRGEAARPRKRLRVTIWIESRQRGKCGFCDHLQDDLKAGRIKINGRNIAGDCDITWRVAEDDLNAAGQAGINGYPTIVCEDTGDRIEGYNSPEKLAGQIALKIQLREGPPRLLGPLPGESSPPAPTSPVPSPALPDAPRYEPEKKDEGTEPEPDVDGVRVIVLLKRQQLGWFENAVPFIETYAKRGFTSRVKSALGDKCEVVVCLERTNRDRYSELMALTGADQEKAVTLIVTAPKKFHGPIGYLVGKVEELLKPLTDRDWKHANVQPVFERIEPENYESIDQALDQTEPKSDETGGGLLAMILASISGGAGILESVLGHRAKVG